MDNLKLAKNILRSNIYMTIATSSKSGRPWASVVYYCIDNKYNFYYISQLSSLHSKNILHRSIVAFTIFDSHQKEGKGNGIQGVGKARLLHDRGMSTALKFYKTSFIKLQPESFKGKELYRFFKIIPKRFYILDPESQVDKRMEVRFNKK